MSSDRVRDLGEEEDKGDRPSQVSQGQEREERGEETRCLFYDAMR
jgi:hypothetical protein